jgi:hypothetical protein
MAGLEVLNNKPNTTITNIDVSRLKEASYVVEVLINNRVYRKNIIIVH